MRKYKPRLIILVLSILISTGFLGYLLFKNLSKTHLYQPKESEILKVPVEAAKENSHPYGNSVSGVLMWENNRNFHEFCAKQKTSIRLAAFQTTLPDPLPGEEDNIALGAQFLKGTVIKPEKIFSMNAVIGPYNRQRGYQEGPTYLGTRVSKTVGGGVCKLASTLYNLAVNANLKIIERYPHSMPVPYVPAGQDATVSDGSKDFKFMNTYAEPIFIWAETKGNTLYMAIYGRTKAPKVTWHHHILSKEPTRIITHFNRDLKPGEKKVIVHGADGLAVKTWLTIEFPNGKIVKKKLGVDYYRPLPHVIEIGK